MERLALALLITLRKLRPYFQAQAIIVMTDQPIKKSISRPDAAGRMVQWAIELSQSVIAEFTLPKPNLKTEYWIAYANGSFVTRAGVVIVPPEKDIFKYRVQLQFPVTNNEAKY